MVERNVLVLYQNLGATPATWVPMRTPQLGLGAGEAQAHTCPWDVIWEVSVPVNPSPSCLHRVKLLELQRDFVAMVPLSGPVDNKISAALISKEEIFRKSYHFHGIQLNRA